MTSSDAATAAYAHTTVLADEAVRLLAPVSGELYCDGTLGGGGHAERVLDACGPDGRLIGVDRDLAALDAARDRLARFGDRVTFVHGRFSELRRIFDDRGIDGVDGLLVDVGVSSPQLDRPERGFSFQRQGPLDMRMDPSTGQTAREACEAMSAEEIARVLRRFGDERYAGRISRAIKESLDAGELHTTTELADLIAHTVPTRERHKDPATRTFQALRILVNDELGELERLLADMPSLLRPLGRFVAISFHSLEDGLVKHRLRELNHDPGLPADIAAQMGVRYDPLFDLLTRKPIEASDEEVRGNPRARSAKLRAARKRP